MVSLGRRTGRCERSGISSDDVRERNAIAQLALGRLYVSGQGVPQDYVLAHKWLNLAAAQGGTQRDIAVKGRDLVDSEMTPEQIAEAQRLAREWMAAFEKRKKN